ncbi:COG4-domain-containing protein [Xylona heveae TC161]|uniref:Conserved oligomeric Golgi complex subunit 4 n=1 Tax=Xylona heveae (strain CBS 132557 / TC161) TaxID=1328760 RepID=A0A165GLU5_XYLHT|nr:COG4-domain-containing protein [Xylona heveae TC161]KZF22350.1 COG4-domain-containing protein [Xylona heveae TC161]
MPTRNLRDEEPGIEDGFHSSGEATSAPDIFKASSVAEIRAAITDLNDREATVTARLNALVASQKDLSRELGRLDLLRANLGSQAVTTRSISNGMLNDAATTANRISSAVRRLDLEQSRVQATLIVVEQVAELKACVLGVAGSMGAAQDWETAASYLSRASKIPPEIISGAFAEEIVPTAEVPDPPNVTLESAAESLCGLFVREFDKASKENDGAKVTRFFKLFPLIGRSHVGLDIYGQYVCQGVASRARANLNAGTGANQRTEGFFYANALTKLFEHIAQIIDGHGTLVERHYGLGKMVKVIERLQMEADVQGGIIIDTWGDERNIDRKLTDIKSYAFSFLVQSFLPAQRTASGAHRTNSPAGRDGVAGPRTSEDEGVDMKEIDALLSETAVMLGRWSLYTRFLATKSLIPEVAINDSSPLTMPQYLLDSNLYAKISDRLISPFNLMTTFFFRRSVEKAFQIDEAPTDLTLNLQKALPSNPPYITSVVDDVMYVVNNVLQRCLATSQRAVIANVLPAISRVLGSDFVGMIQRKMRDECYPKGAVQGALPPEDKILAFLVQLNNLDVATDYTKRIVQSRLDIAPPSGSPSLNGDGAATTLVDLFPFNQDGAFVTSALHSLEVSFHGKTYELIGDGINVLFGNVLKPRLRPILADSFRDVDYLLTSEEISAAEAHDVDGGELSMENPWSENYVRERFAQGWEALTQPFARILTARNIDKLLNVTATYLSRLLEKRIWSYHGRINELGAVRLERDIANLVTVVTSGRYALRDTFTRCTQICIVINLEEEEWDELQSTPQKATEELDIQWRLEADERERARAMVLYGPAAR